MDIDDARFRDVIEDDDEDIPALVGVDEEEEGTLELVELDEDEDVWTLVINIAP